MKKIIFISFLIMLFNNIINAEITCYQVVAGWNLIGSPCDGNISDIVTTDPPGIITGNWYRYIGGYQSTTTLTAAEGYWVKVSQAGIICFDCPCGSVIPNCGTVDYGGKIYNTVYIGTQCWLRENLDIGIMILSNSEPANNTDIEKYCYNDISYYCKILGGLYQWDEAVKYTNPPTLDSTGICPPGWHIPSKIDLQILKTAVNNDGNALKALGHGVGSGVGTNTSGFTGLLGGYCTDTGIFEDLGLYLNIFSSTPEETGLPEAYVMGLPTNQPGIYINHELKAAGYSIRCLKD